MQKILTHARLFGKDAGLTTLTSGFYQATYNKSTSGIQFEWMKDSHADLWASFLNLLQKLIMDTPTVSASTQDKMDTMDVLSDMLGFRQFCSMLLQN